MIKIIPILLLCLFSLDASAQWTMSYTFSKFENRKIPLLGWNNSNEDNKIQLDLHLNTSNQIGLWMVGFPYGYNIGMVFPPNNPSEYYTPFRLRIGTRVFNLRGSALFLINDKWTFPIALERGTNAEVIKYVLESLEKKEEIAVEFSNTGEVYTFNGGIRKLN